MNEMDKDHYKLFRCEYIFSSFFRQEDFQINRITERTFSLNRCLIRLSNSCLPASHAKKAKTKQKDLAVVELHLASMPLSKVEGQKSNVI